MAISTVLRATALAGFSVIYGLMAASAVALTFGTRRTWLPFVCRTWARVGLRLSGITMEVEGLEHVAERVPRVVTFNHQSLLDALVVCSILPSGSTAIVKKEALSYPGVGSAIGALGFLTLDREDRGSAMKILDEAAARIKGDRLTVFIAPEGTRAPTAELLPFKRGAFHLARQADAPLVPMVIEGARPLQPKGRFAVHPGHVRVRFLAPIPPEQWATLAIGDQATQLRDLYSRTLQEMDLPTAPLELAPA